MRHLLCSCRLLLRRMLTPKCLFIYFQHRQLSKEQYRPFVPSFVSSYCPRCKGSLVSPSPVFYATDSLKGPQFCMHLVVENKCVNSTCIYHSPRLCGHSVGLVCNCDSRVVYSVFSYHQRSRGPGLK